MLFGESKNLSAMATLPAHYLLRPALQVPPSLSAERPGLRVSSTAAGSSCVLTPDVGAELEEKQPMPGTQSGFLIQEQEGPEVRQWVKRNAGYGRNWLGLERFERSCGLLAHKFWRDRAWLSSGAFLRSTSGLAPSPAQARLAFHTDIKLRHLANSLASTG